MKLQPVVPAMAGHLAAAEALPGSLTDVIPGVSLRLLGTTYSMAQSVAWIDRDTFAIGRWDGTLTLFGLPRHPDTGPRIESAAVSPALAGIEMISGLDPDRFVTSNDQSSLLVYGLSSGLTASGSRLDYDLNYGMANSGTTVVVDGGRWLVTGHESGALLIWQVDVLAVRLHTAIDLRSPAPIPTPAPVKNIRAVVSWRGDVVVTGSEDGDLCVVRVPSGEVIDRRRYNPKAQRGINDISVSGNRLVVANCSFGSADKNCWAFQIGEQGRLELLDSVNLASDPVSNPVFNFAVESVQHGKATLFACATEEGLLWVGEVGPSGISVGASLPVSSGRGAAVSYGGAAGVLAVVGDNVHLFELLDESDP